METIVDIIKSNALTNVDINSEGVVSVMNKIVKSYTNDLDTIMNGVSNDIVNVDNPSLDVLEKYFFELTNCIYFMNERVENVGLQDDISKLILNSSYNDAYINHKNSNNGVAGAKKPTDGEANTIAEQKTIEESAVNSLYNRTYKAIKGKIDSAQTMVASISKIISLRSQEMQLTQIQPNVPVTRQVLNESEVRF